MPPALPAHPWALGQKPGLLTSVSQTNSVAWRYECALCSQRPTHLLNAGPPWHNGLTSLHLFQAPHLKTGHRIVLPQGIATED